MCRCILLIVGMEGIECLCLLYCMKRSLNKDISKNSTDHKIITPLLTLPQKLWVLYSTLNVFAYLLKRFRQLAVILFIINDKSINDK